MQENALLDICTLLVMMLLAWLHWHQGVFSAAVLFVNVLLAGLLAFSLFEPISTALAKGSEGAGRWIDAIVLLILFCGTLVLLRVFTSLAAPAEIDLSEWAHKIGGAVLGLATGYFVCGMMVCMFQTLPWPEERFMGYDPQKGMAMAADRAWLGVVRWGTDGAFDWPDERPFDPDRYLAFYAARRGESERVEQAYTPYLDGLVETYAKAQKVLDAGDLKIPEDMTQAIRSLLEQSLLATAMAAGDGSVDNLSQRQLEDVTKNFEHLIKELTRRSKEKGYRGEIEPRPLDPERVREQLAKMRGSMSKPDWAQRQGYLRKHLTEKTFNAILEVQKLYKLEDYFCTKP